MATDHSIFVRPKYKTTLWTDAQLDDLRQVTDEPADRVVGEFFAEQKANNTVQQDNGHRDPHKLLMGLMNHRLASPEAKLQDHQIPQGLLDQLEEQCPLPEVESQEVMEGQQVFRDHGPEILLALCCYSLPMAYGAANGARVLHETGYLENRVARRLVETTQMVIDVMKPDGLDPGGDGLRTAHEIRLMHAAIRHLIDNGDHDWNADWGRPINQEDMAGTLMTFSYVVLDGLSKMGIRLDRDAQESYLAAWCSIGRTMGLQEALIPNDMVEAQELTWLIYDRQMRGSEQGRDLIQALLRTIKTNVPFFAQDTGAAMLRTFMEPELADELRVPRHLVLDNVTRLFQQAFGAFDNLVSLDPLNLKPYRWFSLLVIKMVTEIGRGHDVRAKFELPAVLHEYWHKTALPRFK